LLKISRECFDLLLRASLKNYFIPGLIPPFLHPEKDSEGFRDALN
jgi:hypothetical protein